MDAIDIPKIINSNGETIIVEMTIEQFNDLMILIIQSTADEEYNAGYEFGCTKTKE